MLKRRTPPYSGTEVDPGRSKMQIEKLLRQYGVDGVSWTEVWSQNRAELRFVLEDDKKRPIMVRLQPPPFAVKRKMWVAEKGRYDQVDAPNWAQSYRLLYNYLKAKLESVAYGLRDIEEEFLSDIVIHDKTGRETTVGEMVGRQIESGEVRVSLPPGNEPEPPKKEGRPGAVDADFQVH